MRQRTAPVRQRCQGGCMSRHIQVTFDAHDPRALSSFWRDVLGYVHPGPPGVDLPEGADPLAAWDDFLTRVGVPRRAAQHAIGHRGPGRPRPAVVLPAGARGQGREEPRPPRRPCGSRTAGRAADGGPGGRVRPARRAGSGPGTSPRARSADGRRPHRDERPRRQRVLPGRRRRHEFCVENGESGLCTFPVLSRNSQTPQWCTATTQRMESMGAASADRLLSAQLATGLTNGDVRCARDRCAAENAAQPLTVSPGIREDR